MDDSYDDIENDFSEEQRDRLVRILESLPILQEIDDDIDPEPIL